MRMRLFRSTTCAFAAFVVAGLALASGASAATTMTATANPTLAGTPAAPQAETLSLNLTVDNDGQQPIPVPVAQSQSVVQTLPAEFASNLASFGSCAESNFDDQATAPGGAEDPTVSCPANSIVGSGYYKNVSTFNPATPGATAAQKVVIVKDSDTGGLAYWATIGPISHFFPGAVSTNGSGQTVISWTTTAFETFPQLYMLEFDTYYNVNSNTLQALEPFASTGCAAGSWAFSAANSFVGGAHSAETANASVACSTPPPPGAPPAAPANTAPPAITGPAQVGATLSESDGSWSGNPVPTLTRQWQLCDSGGNGCSDISGATGATYTVQSGDANHTIRVAVTGTNASGSVGATSAQTGVIAGTGIPPATIAGTASIGSKTANVAPNGGGSFNLKCSSAGMCTGTFQIVATGAQASKAKSVVIGSGRYSVAAGKTGAVRFKLTGKGKALLRKHHGKLRTTLKVKPKSGATKSAVLTLKLKK